MTSIRRLWICWANLSELLFLGRSLQHSYEVPYKVALIQGAIIWLLCLAHDWPIVYAGPQINCLIPKMAIHTIDMPNAAPSL